MIHKSIAAGTLALLAGAAAAGDAEERGRLLVERGACMACHGPGLDQPTDPATPRLAGQHRDYLLAALRGYSLPDHAQIGRKHAVMSALVQNYQAGDLADMAHYIAALPGKVKVARSAGFKR